MDLDPDPGGQLITELCQFIHVLNMLHLKSTALLKDTVQKRQIYCISIFIPELRTLFLSLTGVPEEPRILSTLRFATNISLSRSQQVPERLLFAYYALAFWESGTTHTLKISEVLKVVTNEKGGAVGEVLTIIC